MAPKTLDQFNFDPVLQGFGVISERPPAVVCPIFYRWYDTNAAVEWQVQYVLGIKTWVQVDVCSADTMQSGVLGSVASTGITATMASSTRVLTFSQWPTNDVIWFLSNGLYIRGLMGSAPSGLAPASGTTSDYCYVSIDAVAGPYGGSCSYVVTTGVAQTTAALAAAAPTAVTAGNIRIWDGVMLNTGGSSWTLVSGGTGINTIPATTGRDRRPWARGGFSQILSNTNASTTSSVQAVIDAAHLSIRLECTGVPIRIRTFICELTTPSGGANLNYWMDGAQQDNHFPAVSQTSVSYDQITIALSPSAGSHLFQPGWASLTNGQTTSLVGSANAQFTVEEIVRSNRSNGLA